MFRIGERQWHSENKRRKGVEEDEELSVAALRRAANC